MGERESLRGYVVEGGGIGEFKSDGLDVEDDSGCLRVGGNDGGN